MKKKFYLAPFIFIVLMILFAQCSNLNNVDYAIYADAPVFSLDQGQYFGTQTVTMTSATEGAYIRYTLDGTEPTKNEGTLYEAAVTIDQNSMLKAVAYKFGYTISRVTTAQYSIIIWKGTLATAPANPEGGWAYYNSTEGISYIYDGTAWQILAKDGADGTDGDGAAKEPNINVKIGSTIVIDGSTDVYVGKTIFNESVDAVFTMENTGAFYALIYGNPKVQITGEGFSLVSDLTVDLLLPGAKANFTIRFSPTSRLKSVYTGIITIPNTDLTKNPYNFTIKGELDTRPIMSVVCGGTEIQNGAVDINLDGSLQIDSSTGFTLTIKVKNIGVESLIFNGHPNVVVSGEGFSLNTDISVGSLPMDGETEFVINYTPTIEKYYTGTITISTNDIYNDPFSFSVKTNIMITPANIWLRGNFTGWNIPESPESDKFQLRGSPGYYTITIDFDEIGFSDSVPRFKFHGGGPGAQWTDAQCVNGFDPVNPGGDPETDILGANTPKEDGKVICKVKGGMNCLTIIGANKYGTKGGKYTLTLSHLVVPDNTTDFFNSTHPDECVLLDVVTERAGVEWLPPYYLTAVTNKNDLAIKGAFAAGWGTCYDFVNASDILSVTIPVDITADSGAFGFVNASNNDNWLGSIRNIAADGTLQGMFVNSSNGSITGLTGVGNYEFKIDVTTATAPKMSVTKK